MTINDIINFFHVFFFDYHVSAFFVGIYRVLTITAILSYLIYIYKDIIIFTEPNGLYPLKSFMANCRSSYRRLNLFNIFTFQNSNYVLTYLLYFFGFLSLIGLFTTISLICFYFILISFQQRVAPINQSGGDIVANIILFCLIFMDSGAAFSVDSCFKNIEISMVDGWPMRLIQISISIGYFWSAIYKINSPEWQSGEALKNAMVFTFWSKYRYLELFRNKYISLMSNYSVLFFQFFSPVLFWVQEFRPYAILYGITIHFLMIINLKIGYFGPIMIVGILSFLASYFN